jgi:transposase
MAEPERYELHHQDETHAETNPYLCRVWHRRGQPPTVPAAGTNRRVTVFGSVEVVGRGRVEVVCAGQDAACFLRYLEALDERHRATEREVYLVLDNGPAHTSKASTAALAARTGWLHVIWLPRYSPEFNTKEREWRWLKRDVRAHLARDLRTCVDEVVAGRRRLGGEVGRWSRSSMRCRNGSSTAITARRPAAHPAARRARRIPVPALPGARTYPHLLSRRPVPGRYPDRARDAPAPPHPG